MTSEEYFGQLGETEAAVVVEDHIAQERALIQDGNVYIDYTLVEREPEFQVLLGCIGVPSAVYDADADI